MRWSTDKANSYTTFKECYETKLKPEKLFSSSLQPSVNRMFEKSPNSNAKDESIYQLLSRLENSYKGCASICQTPLFYLTQDLSLGLPLYECIDKAMMDAMETARHTGIFTLILGLNVFVSMLFTFGVCTKYRREIKEKDLKNV